MSVTISPLDLMLDTENPRFVILSNREQVDIRKYLVTYEDVCQLATAIKAIPHKIKRTKEAECDKMGI